MCACYCGINTGLFILSKVTEYQHHISEPKLVDFRHTGVYLLYVVSAKLGVLNLLPTIGQLWGHNKQGKSRTNSLPVLLWHHEGSWMRAMRNDAFDRQLHSRHTSSRRTSSTLLLTDVCLGAERGGSPQSNKRFSPAVCERNILCFCCCVTNTCASQEIFTHSGPQKIAF